MMARHGARMPPRAKSARFRLPANRHSTFIPLSGSPAAAATVQFCEMKRYLIALVLSGIVDAISYMVVTPSLVFYVTSCGGTKEQYGLIMSSFSFSSFCFKPVLGAWSDASGFRVPFLTSLGISTLGGLVYLAASALPYGRPAIMGILAARLLGGCGAANSALGFAYVARGTPREEQTSVNSMLSMMRILGMAIGPGVNILVSWINVDFGSWSLTPLNSVGLILIVCNLAAIVAILVFLEEPEFSDEDEGEGGENDVESVNKPMLSKQSSSFAASTLQVTRAFMSIDILVPLLSLFMFNANFQLIETGFAPAAYDALGWEPVQTSLALGSVSFIIALCMYVVMNLSKRGASDTILLTGGLIVSTLAYTALYFAWTQTASGLRFYLPIAAAASSFPFLGAPTRSLFTVAIDSKPVLKKSQGSMQAVLSMGASVAGFVAPGLIAAYCLRHPDEVEASKDKRELSPWSLIAPLLSLLTLLGVAFVVISNQRKAAIPKRVQESEMSREDEKALGETAMLLTGGKPEVRRNESVRGREQRSSMLATLRSSSCQCGMGLTQARDGAV